MVFSIFEKNKLSDFNPQFSREDLIKHCRILVIDDEKPELISDLINQGFSVDHDPDGADTAKIERHLYDLILLDFGDVGAKFGKDEGLSLLRHIKRIGSSTFSVGITWDLKFSGDKV